MVFRSQFTDRQVHSSERFICKNVKVKCSRYRLGVAQRVGRSIALLFHDRGTRRGWVVSRTPRPHFTPGKEPVPILQEAGWATGPVWTGGKSRPHRDSIPDINTLYEAHQNLQDGQCTYDATLRRLRAATFAVEKQ